MKRNKRNRGVGSFLAGAACLMAGSAQATCLYVDWNDMYHPFVNTCGVGIDSNSPTRDRVEGGPARAMSARAAVSAPED